MAENLTPYTDAYLEFHHHSVAAYERVIDVMGRWEFMVKLYTDRALEELFVPENVIQVDLKQVKLTLNRLKHTPLS